MITKVLDTIEKYNMISLNDKIVVGVSGGPDSICLLDILNSIKEKYNIDIIAAHINHCLRGEEADKDEKYVKKFCENNNIEFYSIKVDIHKLSKEKSISCEMAGREARYSFFEQVMKKTDANKVAIAHNANDQCETVLMRIMRGTGIEGLVGIKPVRDYKYIRPLINITRFEIENYCKVNNLNPRIDKTNLETIYSRNKVRLELIPYIKEHFNQDIINAVNRLSENISLDSEYIENMSQRSFEKFCKISSDEIIIKKHAFNEHKSIINRILRKAIQGVNGNLYNYEKKHIDDIVALQKGETGKKIMLPNNILALNSYKDIHISNNIVNVDKKYKELYKLQIGHNCLECGMKIKLELVENNNELLLDKNKYVKYFDYNKINDNIILRYRKQGDKFSPLGMKGSKKLKDIFMDLKIPRDKRDNIPLVCFENEIAWIVGYKISEKFKVDNNTIKILKVKMESEETK